MFEQFPKNSGGDWLYTGIVTGRWWSTILVLTGLGVNNFVDRHNALLLSKLPTGVFMKKNYNLSCRNENQASINVPYESRFLK